MLTRFLLVPLLSAIAVQNFADYSDNTAGHPHGQHQSKSKGLEVHPHGRRKESKSLTTHAHGTRKNGCRSGSCSASKPNLAGSESDGVVQVKIVPANKKHAGTPTGLSMSVGSSITVDTGSIEEEKTISGVQTQCVSGAQDITLENVLTGKGNGFLLQWISFNYANGDCYIPSGIVTPENKNIDFPPDGFWLDTPCDSTYEYEQQCYEGRVKVIMVRSAQCDMPSLQASIRMGTSNNAQSKTGITLQVGSGPVVSAKTLVETEVKVDVPAIGLEGPQTVVLTARDTDGYNLDWFSYVYSGDGSRCYVPDKMRAGGETRPFPDEGLWLDKPCTKSSYYGQACYEEVILEMKMHPTSCEKNQPFPDLQIRFEAASHVDAPSRDGLTIKVGSTGEEVASGPLGETVTSKALSNHVGDVDTVTLAPGGSDGYLMKWFSLQFDGDSVCYVPTTISYNGVTEAFPSVGLAFDRESTGKCDDLYDYSPHVCYYDPVVFHMTAADSCDPPVALPTLVRGISKRSGRALQAPDGQVDDVCQPVPPAECHGSTAPGEGWFTELEYLFIDVDTSQFGGTGDFNYFLLVTGEAGPVTNIGTRAWHDEYYASVVKASGDSFRVRIASKKWNYLQLLLEAERDKWRLLWSRVGKS